MPYTPESSETDGASQSTPLPDTVRALLVRDFANQTPADSPSADAA